MRMPLVLVGAGSDHFGIIFENLLFASRRPLGIFMGYHWAIGFGASALLLSFGAKGFGNGPGALTLVTDFGLEVFFSATVSRHGPVPLLGSWNFELKASPINLTRSSQF